MHPEGAGAEGARRSNPMTHTQLEKNVNIKETISVYTNNSKVLIRSRTLFLRALSITFITGGLFLGSLSSVSATEQTTFKSPAAAVDALATALAKEDEKALLTIFGEEHKEALIGGDLAASRVDRETITEALQERNELRNDSNKSKTLLIGSKAWPFPFPLIKEGNVWRFDTEAGIEEVVNRRIGRNELNAIEICRAYVDAQVEYSSVDHDGDEVLEYAQKIASSKGKQDGLYWEEAKGKTLSPFGPLVADAKDYLEDHEPGDPFKGYYYKIITRQSANAPGGRYDYIINGNMIAGFAMIAFPADHGNSGIMSFICNHQGKVFQKNMGSDSDLIAGGVVVYDPDASWTQTKD